MLIYAACINPEILQSSLLDSFDAEVNFDFALLVAPGIVLDIIVDNFIPVGTPSMRQNRLRGHLVADMSGQAELAALIDM